MKKYIPLVLLWMVGYFMKAKPETIVEVNTMSKAQHEKNITGCSARIAIMYCPKD